MPRPAPTAIHAEHGFSLIEILVTLLVTSVALLSLIMLQTKSLQHSHASYQKSVAVTQAMDLTERLWAGVCSLDDHLNDIRSAWQQDHQNTTGMYGWNGSLSEDRSATPYRYNIQINWSDERLGRTDDNQYSFSYSAVMPPFQCD